jgi:hypothetical protein
MTFFKEGSRGSKLSKFIAEPVESELPEAAMMMLSAVVVCQFLLFWF